jgi:hypothetical protein
MTLANALIFMYAATWMMGGLFQTGQSAAWLMAISFLPATWFFFKGIFSTLFRNAVITMLLVVVSCFFPPLFVLIGLWGSVCLMMRFVTFMRNLIPICVGAVLYILAAIVPKWLVTSLHPNINNWFGLIGYGVEVVVLGVVGTLLMALAIRLFQGMDYSRNRSAALMMGFPVYLFLFTLLLFLPGADDDGGDHDS